MKEERSTPTQCATPGRRIMAIWCAHLSIDRWLLPPSPTAALQHEVSALADARQGAVTLRGVSLFIYEKNAKAGGLATQTEIVAGQDQQPMLGINSVAAMEGAISMYEEIVAGGGWEELPSRTLKKGSKGEAVIALRQRLIRENYLSFDSLSSETASVYDQEMVDAVKAFQINHGILPSGTVASLETTWTNATKVVNNGGTAIAGVPK